MIRCSFRMKNLLVYDEMASAAIKYENTTAAAGSARKDMTSSPGNSASAWPRSQSAYLLQESARASALPSVLGPIGERSAALRQCLLAAARLPPSTLGFSFALVSDSDVDRDSDDRCCNFTLVKIPCS